MYIHIRSFEYKKYESIVTFFTGNKEKNNDFYFDYIGDLEI